MPSLRAPAKINLGLHVLRKRDDGFHAVETVMHRIGWADRVTVEAAEALSMTCSDPDLPTDVGNLCMQAAAALRERVGTSKGARIHLEKHVPYGAGLGGGSSDAAATLQLLVDLWDLDLADAVLHEVAASIGSDVPFFLLDVPAALATGRGEVLTPLMGPAGPVRVDATMVVAVPPVAVSTPAAYGRVTPNDEARPDLAALVRSGDVAQWREALVNDFQAPVAGAEPAVRAALDEMRAAGADYTSLSGSGSAVFGVFTDSDRAERAARRAEENGCRVHRTDPSD